MARYFMVVEANCTDPKREKEFNDWYTNAHIPDVAEVPGLIRATRFKVNKELMGKAQAKYLALYEIEAESYETWEKTVLENLTKKGPERGMGEGLASVAAQIVYKEISSFTK